MRRYFYLLLIILPACISCRQQDKLQQTLDVQERFNIDSSEVEALLVIKKEGPVSPKPVFMELETNTDTFIQVKIFHSMDETLVFGSFYVLEKNVNGCWFPVDYIMAKEAIGWHDISYELSAEDLVVWETDWRCIYGGLEDGIYRLGKNYYIKETPRKKDMVFVEFSVGIN